MSLRTLRIPGMKLGLGTFINNDVDAKRRVIWALGATVWATTAETVQFTQGQTKMATVECVIANTSGFHDEGSASLGAIKIATISGGTVTLRGIMWGAGDYTDVHEKKLHFWMVGTPDPNRIVI